MSSETPAIKVENVSKKFTVYNKQNERLLQMATLGLKRYGKDFWAVRDVSFTVYPGESVGLLGVNGAGKSTMLQMITGTVTPSEGRIETNGRISALLELGAGFSPEFTGRENVYLNGCILGMGRADIDSCLGRITEFAGIGDFLDRPVRTYSSGMFVRLAFAVATNLNPDILIVDEALSVGDTEFQQRCYTHLRTNLNKTTRLFVTHDLGTLSSMTQRVLLLDKGRLVFDGATSDALKEYSEMTRKGTQISLSQPLAGHPEKDMAPYEYAYACDGDIRNGVLRVPDETTLCGAEDVAVTGVAFLPEGFEAGTIRPGDTVLILIRVKSRKAHAIAGLVSFEAKDRHGASVVGQDTSSYIADDLLLRPGISLFEFSLTWPTLRSGDYTISFGVSACEPGNPSVSEPLCWVPSAVRIRCVNPAKGVCLLSIPLDAVRVGVPAKPDTAKA